MLSDRIEFHIEGPMRVLQSPVPAAVKSAVHLAEFYQVVHGGSAPQAKAPSTSEQIDQLNRTIARRATTIAVPSQAAEAIEFNILNTGSPVGYL